MFLNGSLSIGNNNTVDLKVFFGHDRVHYNLNYINTLNTDLQIKGIEVSSKSMFLQYPNSHLLSSPDSQSVYLGTLTYDPTEEFNSCRNMLCHILPVKNVHGTDLEQLPSSVSLSMLQKRAKAKQYYYEMENQYESEVLSIKTDLAGVLNVNIHIHPVVLNLFNDPRHQLSGILSKSMYTILDSLGFSLDWFNHLHSSPPRHYRYFPSIQVDQELFFNYYVKGFASYSYHTKDLCEIKALSIKNGQHVTVYGQDVHLFGDTVVNTSHSSTIPVYNPLEVPLLVRLVTYPEGELPSTYIRTNCSDVFTVSESAVTEAMIPPNSKVELGPILFAPTDLGVCSSYFFIVNNYTNLEPRTQCVVFFISDCCRKSCPTAFCSHG